MDDKKKAVPTVVKTKTQNAEDKMQKAKREAEEYVKQTLTNK